MTRRRILYILILFFALLAATLRFGETPWDFASGGAWNRFLGNSHEWNPILDERLPRLLVLLSSGASLATAGAVMQSLFQNPLAAPNVLGISAGGTLAAIVVFIFGWHISYPFSIPIASVGGSLTILFLVYKLSKSGDKAPVLNLLLTGIAFSTVLIALQGALLYAFRDHWQLIQVITEWQSGSTLDRTWNHVHMQLPLTVIGLAGCLYYREEMNILALGDMEAANLGLEVQKVRWRLFLCVALLTGGALASVGMIAFFGLVLPHLLRIATSPDNRTLIPLCIIMGGITLAAVDLLMRFMHIRLFTIGNVSAVFGGLFFLALLVKPRKRFQLLEE